MAERESPEQQFNRLERCRDIFRWFAVRQSLLAQGAKPTEREPKAYMDLINHELDVYAYGELRPDPSLEDARTVAQASLKEHAINRTQQTEEFDCITPEMVAEYDRKFKRGLL